MISGPCLNCKDRDLYCHDCCDKYLKYKDLCQKVAKENRMESILNNHVKETVHRFTGKVLGEI